MLKIAHFSPLPPQKSGIADYCARLLPHLAAHLQVDAYADVDEQTDPTVAGASSFPIYPLARFLEDPVQRWQYDLCLYHMGNHPAYHQTIYDCLQRYPGVVVLHEVNLHAFFSQQPRHYAREMGFAGGRNGLNMARYALAGARPLPETTHPLFNRLLQTSLGLIVHTHAAQRALHSRPGDTPITTIPLAVAPPATFPALPPLDLDLPPETLILASFGYIAPNKRLPIVLEALARLRPEVPPFRYLLVGQPIAGYDIDALIQAWGLADVVIQTGFVEEAMYGRYLHSCHIGINLRTGPTGGEMSASLLDLLACGRAAIVSNNGGFADLPNDTVLKIDQNEDEVNQLVSALRLLLTNPARRERLGTAARQYTQTFCAFPHVARQYADFLHHCLARARQRLETAV